LRNIFSANRLNLSFCYYSVSLCAYDYNLTNWRVLHSTNERYFHTLRYLLLCVLWRSPGSHENKKNVYIQQMGKWFTAFAQSIVIISTKYLYCFQFNTTNGIFVHKAPVFLHFCFYLHHSCIILLSFTFTSTQRTHTSSQWLKAKVYSDLLGFKCFCCCLSDLCILFWLVFILLNVRTFATIYCALLPECFVNICISLVRNQYAIIYTLKNVVS
jgi:hypothetical protein